MRSRDVAVGSLVLAVLFGVLPNFVPLYDFDGGIFGADSQVYTWGVESNGDSETWFDQDGNSDEDKEQVNLLRAAMVLHYIGLGFATLAILGVFFRDSVSHFGILVTGAILFVSNVLFFHGADFAVGRAAAAGLTLYFLSTFFAVLAAGHAMRRL